MSRRIGISTQLEGAPGLVRGMMDCVNANGEPAIEGRRFRLESLDYQRRVSVDEVRC